MSRPRGGRRRAAARHGDEAQGDRPDGRGFTRRRCSMTVDRPTCTPARSPRSRLLGARFAALREALVPGFRRKAARAERSSRRSCSTSCRSTRTPRPSTCPPSVPAARSARRPERRGASIHVHPRDAHHRPTRLCYRPPPRPRPGRHGGGLRRRGAATPGSTSSSVKRLLLAWLTGLPRDVPQEARLAARLNHPNRADAGWSSTRTASSRHGVPRSAAQPAPVRAPEGRRRLPPSAAPRSRRRARGLHHAPSSATSTARAPACAPGREPAERVRRVRRAREGALTSASRRRSDRRRDAARLREGQVRLHGARAVRDGHDRLPRGRSPPILLWRCRGPSLGGGTEAQIIQRVLHAPVPRLTESAWMRRTPRCRARARAARSFGALPVGARLPRRARVRARRARRGPARRLRDRGGALRARPRAHRDEVEGAAQRIHAPRAHRGRRGRADGRRAPAVPARAELGLAQRGGGHGAHGVAPHVDGAVGARRARAGAARRRSAGRGRGGCARRRGAVGRGGSGAPPPSPRARSTPRLPRPPRR